MLFILIGTIELKSTRERGNFYCPTCGVNESYRLRAQRTFLTVYFIPLVPISSAELFVQCDQCKSTWDQSVLTMDRASHEAAKAEQFRDEAIRAALLVVLEDDSISDQEINALLGLSRGLLEHPITRDELGQLCSIARANSINARNYVLTISKHWNQQQREVAIKAMFLAASAEGDISPGKMAVLVDAKDMFDMTEMEFQAAIDQAIEMDTA